MFRNKTRSRVRVFYFSILNIRIKIMIENLPIWIDLTFIFTFVLTIILFHFSNGEPKKLTLFIIVWSIMQSILAYIGFYQNTDSIPPRFGLVLIPITSLIIYGLLPRQQNGFLKQDKLKLARFYIQLGYLLKLFYLDYSSMI